MNERNPYHLGSESERWEEWRDEEIARNFYPITFKRVALNLHQIRQFNPPPFPAKLTSARYNGYIREHGTNDAWELDALDPLVLRQLIRDEVNALFDVDVHEDNEEIIEDLREEMRQRMRAPGWAQDALNA